MKYISHQMCLSNAWQSSEVYKFVLVLQVFDKLIELNLSRYKIHYLCLDILKLDMIAATVKVSLLVCPARIAVLR